MLPALDAWVKKEAKLYRVSKAFVLANCVSFASRIPMVSYRELDREKTSRRKTLQFKRRA